MLLPSGGAERETGSPWDSDTETERVVLVSQVPRPSMKLLKPAWVHHNGERLQGWGG